jgi:hypothetical protein
VYGPKFSPGFITALETLKSTEPPVPCKEKREQLISPLTIEGGKNGDILAGASSMSRLRLGVDVIRS